MIVLPTQHQEHTSSICIQIVCSLFLRGSKSKWAKEKRQTYRMFDFIYSVKKRLHRTKLCSNSNPLFCKICISYCLSGRGMSRLWAPHQAGLSGDTPMSGSSKGFESPRKKCKSGTAKSHSGLEVQASFINLLQRLSIALTAKLAKHNSKLTNHTLNESKVVYNHILYQRRSIPIELHSPIARRLAYFYTSHL